MSALSLREHDKVMRKFGMLFQGAALFDSLPVWENVGFGLLATKAIKRADAQARLPSRSLRSSASARRSRIWIRPSFPAA